MLALALAAAPRALRVGLGEVPPLAAFGVLGVTGVNLGYYEAISRIPLGLALVIQYLSTVFVLAWLRLRGERVGSRLWVAAALSLAGCFFAVGAYDGAVFAVNAAGASIALATAVLFSLYFLLADRLMRRHPPQVVLAWAFGFATLAWSARRPIWELPWAAYGRDEWLTIAAVILIGTVLSFNLSMLAVRRLAAARGSIAATLEPVLAAAAAWVVLGETLAPPQIAGCAMVLAGIVVAQSARRAGH